MTIQNIQELYEKRKKWVEANQENNFDDGIKRLLTDLYPDNAHFIYELLQNAEDAGASKVKFILHNDKVEFEHNGDRLFSIEDVESITSIGVSTKKDEPTNIGKFGVGFKAVFAYTNTPEIHSGDFHFRICDLVVPDINVLETSVTIDKKITNFLFPFDNPKKSKENALKEIQRNLKQLNETTLLFLKNIKKIEYILPDSSLGFLERIEHDKNRIEIAVKRPEDNILTFFMFLRFEKNVQLHDESGKLKSCRIAVAFKLKKIPQWEIKPLEHGKVCIYFPADKETSNLKFHIHAPFASTVARDSVRDCEANNKLRDCLAELIADSMIFIRDRGLLTMGFLQTLPNDKDNLTTFYKPIQKALIEIFKSKELTPMKIGGHAPASKIFRGLVQISNLIKDEDLVRIMGEGYSSPIWVANPPQRNQREDNFLSTLGISEWTTEELVNYLKSDSNKIEQWLRTKTDEWHKNLYIVLNDYLSDISSKDNKYSTIVVTERVSGKYRNQLISNNIAEKKKKILQTLRIIRLSDGSYSIGSKCFFPTKEIEHDKIMLRVSKSVYNFNKSEGKDKAREFLEFMGVKEVGEAEQVEAILQERYSQLSFYNGSLKPNISDIKRFIALINKDESKSNLFKHYHILKLSNGKWGKPSQTYIDLPFADTGLKIYYDAVGEKAQCWGLSTDYLNCGVSLEKIISFAEKIGVATSLEIKKEEKNHDINYNIDFLDQVLNSKNLSISKLVWKTLIKYENKADYDYLYRSKKAVKFYNHKVQSDIVSTLKLYKWIPQKIHQNEEIEFVYPSEADSKLLPDGFQFDSGWKWVKAVEFGSSVIKRQEAQFIAEREKDIVFQKTEEVVKKLGFISSDEAKEIADLKNKDPEGFKKWKERNIITASFPNKPVTIPERRQEKIIEQFTDAPLKEYEARTRNVRVSSGAIDKNIWLKNNYTNEDYKMVCQICKKEMPFKKRNGEYYFEAVEMLSNKYFLKEHEAQFLALCPLCAAMFKEFIKNDDNAMKKLVDDLNNSVSSEIPIKLDIETTIKFVDVHWNDLRIIIAN